MNPLSISRRIESELISTLSNVIFEIFLLSIELLLFIDMPLRSLGIIKRVIPSVELSSPLVLAEQIK